MALRKNPTQLAMDRPGANGDASLVGGTQLRFRREFTDASLSVWDVLAGSGQTVTAGGGSGLVITTGTTANAATSVTTKETFSAPFKAAFGFKLSQKIANQDFFVEVIAVDVNGVVDETIVASWRISGTDSLTTTIARAEVRNGQAARSQSGNLNAPSQTADAIYEIVVESDEVTFHNKGADSLSAKSNSYVRNTIAPDPNKLYKLRYRVVNGATPPATTTTFTSSFVTCVDYSEILVELTGAQGSTQPSSSMPVNLTGGAVSANQGSGSSSQMVNAGGWAGFMVADVASAAITGTATTGATTPGVLGNVGVLAHSFNVIVTAVSGTTPTLDVGIEESVDNGTNWIRIYDFPRITANGAYTSPLIRAQWGTRYRYVQTVAGTTPSFTRAINRVQFTAPGEIHKQFFDRSIVLTTLNSSTPIWNVDGADFFQTIVNLGAATTAPVLQLQGSEDGTAWYNIGATFTPTASATTVTVNKDTFPRFARIIVATAGAAVTPGYVSLKAIRN